MTDPKTAKKCADRLQGVAEENRIRILECLLDGPKNVTEIAKRVKLEIVNVSHHLGVLRQAKLVENEKDGRFVVYSLHEDFLGKRGPGQGASLDLGWCILRIAGS